MATAPPFEATTAESSSFCFQLPCSADSILFESGDGVYITDRRGRTFLDALSGIFVTCFGYGCRPIIDAMSRQIEKLAFHSPLLGTNAPALHLSEALVGIAPGGFDCVQLVNGGSESVEAAMRLVRLYQRALGYGGKYKILSNYHGYHGSTYGALSLTGRPDVARFDPRLAGVVRIWVPDCIETMFGVDSAAASAACAKLIERTVEAEGPDSIAAIIVEPIVHLLGMAVPPPDYLRTLRAICDRHEILLIFDEIVTGFGRTGHPFAAHAFDVLPDIMCVGKGISGGYAPLAAVLMSERVSAVLRDEHGLAASGPSHTYAANPVSAAAGLAAVRLLDNHMLERVGEIGAFARRRLELAVGGRGTVRGMGLLYGIKLAASPDHDPVPDLGERVARACLERNVIIRGSEDWVALAPAYIATESEIEVIADTLSAAIADVQAAR
jgi:beta-alanine--pyruvate transaminase